jgi:hypothetical protein
MGEQMRLAALIALMFSGMAFGAVEVTIVSSRGALTNQVAFATNTFLSAEDSEFYKQTISVTPIDMIAEARDGTNFVNGIDFSFVSVGTPRATLVAPRYAVSCEHWHHGVGDDVIFGAHTAKVIRVELDPIYFPDGTPFIHEGEQQYYDYCFMELDRDIPIEHCLVAPVVWSNFFEPIGSWWFNDVPIFVIKQDGSIMQAEIYTVSKGDVGGNMQPSSLWIGDSGSPVFLIIRGKPILLGVASATQNYKCIDRDLMPVERGWGL